MENPFITHVLGQTDFSWWTASQEGGSCPRRQMHLCKRLCVWANSLLWIHTSSVTGGRRPCVWPHFDHWYFACMLSWVQLFITPWTVARQVPLSMGFPRQEYWSGLPFSSPGDLPGPGICVSCISCISRRILYWCATWEAWGSLNSVSQTLSTINTTWVRYFKVWILGVCTELLTRIESHSISRSSWTTGWQSWFLTFVLSFSK